MVWERTGECNFLTRGENDRRGADSLFALAMIAPCSIFTSPHFAERQLSHDPGRWLRLRLAALAQVVDYPAGGLVHEVRE
jgi:hypothetical protein